MMRLPLLIAASGLILTAFVAAPQNAAPQNAVLQSAAAGSNLPGAPVRCDGRLNDQFNAVKADPALTPEQRDARLTEVWDACGNQVLDSIMGEQEMALKLSIDASVAAAIDGADRDSADARADAAVAGLEANSQDPDHRVTNALVAQHRRDRRAAD